ncbi:MAG TPA: PTS sucrose transporter subunit IIBC, partial [Lachnospiraceae bacterium]|nr:PTS sucrose transporter subunit IIBC [Lachnospiraceae bacterium]
GLMVAIYEAGYEFFPGLEESDFGKILSAIAYSVFTILPIIVGYNTAKEFGGSPILGAVLASILNAAAITGVHILGIECEAGRGGVISVLIVAAIGAKLERAIRKKMPEILDTFLTPLFTIFIMTFLGLIVFQPIAGFVSDAVGNFVQYIIYNVPALAGLATLVYLPLVMTGMHHGLIAVNAQLISDFGVTYLLPVTCMAGAGQVGAAFYVFLKTKNKRLKKICKNALPVGMLGIGEPLMWGVTVPLGKPFLASCLGGAVGGSAMAMMHVAAKIPELSGLQLSLITTSPVKYLIAVAISYAAGFLFCMLLGFTDPEEE